MELSELAARILDSFDSLRRLLADRGVCSDEEIVVYDDPLRVVIKRDRIEFYVDDEHHGFVSKDCVAISDEVAEEAKLWLEGLAFLKFRRFSIKR